MLGAARREPPAERQGPEDRGAGNTGTDTPPARIRTIFTVHGTRKFLDRVGGPDRAEVPQPTTFLGDWYATVLFWKPQVGLFVNESTLLPVLMPFAPAATLIERFPATLATVLRRHGIGQGFIDDESAAMTDHGLATTKNRRMVGMLTELSFLDGVYAESNEVVDLVQMSLRLAEAPCGPLYGRHGGPDRELAAYIARVTG